MTEACRDELGNGADGFPGVSEGSCEKPNNEFGIGPCERIFSPLEPKLPLNFTYQTFAVHYQMERANPATFCNLLTASRVVGQFGINDPAGLPIQQALGYATDAQLNYSQTTFGPGGYPGGNLAFLIKRIGFVVDHPLHVSNLAAVGGATWIDGYAVGQRPMVGTGAAGSLFGVYSWRNAVEQILWEMFISSFHMTITMDSTTRMEWVLGKMKSYPGGEGIDNSAAGNHGVAAPGLMRDLRVNIRANGGDCASGSNSRRLLINFVRDPSFSAAGVITNVPQYNSLGVLNLNAAGDRAGLSFGCKVILEGCLRPDRGNGGACCNPCSGMTGKQIAEWRAADPQGFADDMAKYAASISQGTK